jgi:pantoate--beta-alanine ligase
VRIARRGADLRDMLEGSRRTEKTIGLVPTMGALHEGHLSLVGIAGRRTDVVVVSVFVNPLQFGPDEDLERYPLDEEGDLAKLEAEGADVTFFPAMQEMYPEGADVMVQAGRLGTIFEGAHRPGHFDGVTTVVAKLFNLVGPDVAVFGQKDAQQVAVIRKMVADLHFPVEIVVGPTHREADGLALSSRNAYLSPEERDRATVLWRALREGAARLEAGASPVDAERSVAQVMGEEPGVETDYAAAVDPVSFGSPAAGGPVLLTVAARVGGVRLIDNLLVERARTSDRGTG